MHPKLFSESETDPDHRELLETAKRLAKMTKHGSLDDLDEPDTEKDSSSRARGVSWSMTELDFLDEKVSIGTMTEISIKMDENNSDFETERDFEEMIESNPTVTKVKENLSRKEEKEKLENLCRGPDVSVQAEPTDPEAMMTTPFSPVEDGLLTFKPEIDAERKEGPPLVSIL